MRDHLLGCQAFMPPEDDGLTRCQKPYPLGIPEGAFRARTKEPWFIAEVEARSRFNALRDFETGDHTPKA